MLSYSIDDPIVQLLSTAVEVTVDLGSRGKRWCFFVTPQLLASMGDYVEDTNVRVHLGVAHMIVVSELSEEVIDRVLRWPHAEGPVEQHTAHLA